MPCHVTVGRLRAVAALLALSASAAATEVPDLPLEVLLKTEVTTASRKSQSLYDVAAAAFVLSADDIARSGATSLPEALRLVPGVEVAQLGAGQWAVSVRGANGRFSNKLLVLVDGRSVYSPLFSGVFWEVEGLLPEDIDRIEVIRGPGAAVWGANAVNGVINVITRRAQQTQGALVSARLGAPAAGGAYLRYGIALDEAWSARIAAQLASDATMQTLGGGSAGRHEARRLSLRADRNGAEGRRLIAASITDVDVRSRWNLPLLSPPYLQSVDVTQQMQVADLMLREERQLSGGDELVIQGSVSRTDARLLVIDGHLTLTDLDVQHRMRLAGGREFTWGGALRHYQDGIADGFPVAFRDNSFRSTRLSAFGQFDWTLVPDRFRVASGVRVDRETDAGTQWQPNIKLLWLPASGHTAWASAGRASRLMSRGEQDADLTYAVLPPQSPLLPLPTEVRVRAPEDALQAERLSGYELGYRGELTSYVFFDAVLFHHRLSRLRSAGVQTPQVVAGPPPRVQLDFLTDNGGSARITGVEAFAEWRPARGWRLQAGGNRQSITETGGDAGGPSSFSGSTPRWQLFARLGADLAAGQSVDLMAKRVAGLAFGAIPAYTRVDLRYARRIGRTTELALIGQNLLDAQHAEITPDQLPAAPAEVRRTVALKLSARF